MNYDFGANWDSKIKPLLDNPKVLRSITLGVNRYLAQFPTKERYKKNTCPATYSSLDYYCCTLMDRKRDELFDRLRKTGELPREFLELEMEYHNCEDDDDDIITAYHEMREDILEPYFTWDKIKYDAESYYLCGSCHWWAPTFELTLAKLVEPTEKWKVRMGSKHSTVINAAGTKVFDLLYWGLDKRLENRMFGDPIPKSKVDKTLGGKLAYQNSSWDDDDE